jgi:NitT/TauT family transport system substrate-binding protein
MLAGLAVVILLVSSLIFFNKTTSPENVSTTTQAPTKVKIGYLPVTQALPLFIAQEQDLFTKNNLNTELIKFEQPTALMEAFLSNQVDVIGFTGATGILSIANSKNPNAFKILNTGYASTANPVDVLVAKDSNVKSIVDLKGKTCGTLAGPQFKAMFTKVAGDSGLRAAPKGTEADINFQELPVSEFATNLSSGAIDCVLGLEPFGTVAESKKIGTITTKSPISQSLGGRFYGVMSAVNSDYLTKNPEAVKNLNKVFNQVIDRANNGESADRKLLVKNLALPELVADKVSLQKFVPNNLISDTDWAGVKSLTDTMVSTGNQPKPSDLKSALWKE